MSIENDLLQDELEMLNEIGRKVVSIFRITTFVYFWYDKFVLEMVIRIFILRPTIFPRNYPNLFPFLRSSICENMWKAVLWISRIRRIQLP